MAELSPGNHCVAEESGEAFLKKTPLFRYLVRRRPEAVLEERECECERKPAIPYQLENPRAARVGIIDGPQFSKPL